MKGNIDLSFPMRTDSKKKRTFFKTTEEHTHAIEIKNVGEKDKPGIVGDVQIGGYVYVTGGKLTGKFYLKGDNGSVTLKNSNINYSYNNPNSYTGIGGSLTIDGSTISGSPTIISKGLNIYFGSKIIHDNELG